jgi:hypothetical protein
MLDRLVGIVAFDMVVVDGGCCRGLFVLVCAGYVLMDMTS